MNISASEWSSGCESGWTVYLDESNPCPRSENNASHHHYSPSFRLNSTSRNRNYEEEEEDMSMVSDASSGPPNLLEVDEEGLFRTLKMNISEKRSNKGSKEHKKLGKYQQKLSYSNNNINLDDTASSPAISYSKMYGNSSNNQASVEHFMGFSQDLSATHFQGNSPYSNQYAFWQSSHPKNSDTAETSHSRGRRWE